MFSVVRRDTHHAATREACSQIKLSRDGTTSRSDTCPGNDSSRRISRFHLAKRHLRFRTTSYDFERIGARTDDAGPGEPAAAVIGACLLVGLVFFAGAFGYLPGGLHTTHAPHRSGMRCTQRRHDCRCRPARPQADAAMGISCVFFSGDQHARHHRRRRGNPASADSGVERVHLQRAATAGVTRPHSSAANGIDPAATARTPTTSDRRAKTQSAGECCGQHPCAGCGRATPRPACHCAA